MMCVLVGMFLFPAKSFAQGIENGQAVGNFYLGVGSALNKSGMEVDGQDLSWGNVGVDTGFSFLYFPSSFLGIGAEIRYAAFQGSETLEYVPGWWYWHTLETDFDLNTIHIMGTGRLNINPHSQIRLYVPFGAGIALSKGSMSYKWDGHEYYSSENYDTSFSWYAGIGLEFETESGLAWGIEARYNAFEHDYEDLIPYVGGHIVETNPERKYVSFMLKLQF